MTDSHSAPLFADPVALARYVSAVIAGMGVLASSGSDRDELRQVALVSLKVFDERSGTKTAQKERKAGASVHGNA